MKNNYTLKGHPYTNTTGRAPVRLSGLAVLLALLVCLGAAFPQRLQAQTEVAKVQASDKQAGDQFGISVGISGDRALVGAFAEDTGAVNAGAWCSRPSKRVPLRRNRCGTAWCQPP